MFRNFRLRKTLKVVLIILAGLLLLGGIILYSAKGWVLDRAIAKAKGKLKAKYDLSLTLDDYTLHGLSRLEMKDMYCLNNDKDTVMAFKEVTVVVKPWAALFGKIRLSDIIAERGMLHISRIQAIKSVSEEVREEETDTTKFGKIKKYARYVRTLADMVPDRFRIGKVTMYYQDSVDNIDAYVDSLTYNNKDFTASTLLTFKGRKQVWKASGTFDKSSLETHMDVHTTGPAFYSFNFVKQIAKADIGFRSFRFDLEDFDDGTDKIRLKGKVNGENVYVFNPKLSKDTVVVNTGGSDFDITITPDKISLSPKSKVRMNGIESAVAIDYGYRKVNDVKTNAAYLNREYVKMNVRMPRIPAQKLIDALPKGTFEKTRGMKIAGDMSYKLDFYLDLTNKDSIHIDSDPEGFGLKILEYGQANLNKLNTSFTYTPYNSRRGIVVGPENPDFLPLESISKYLRDAVLTREDPSFFYHKGFVERAFEQSFLKNLDKGEFVRGGSTITMQLVKNVFLSHQKTIDRKLEETFLVWLLENLRISSKSRMFEVYLNVIEWGPNVYGAQEAARFYFNKSASSLSLNEALFMSVIVPRPLAFAWRFDEKGELRNYVQNEINFTAKVMARRGLIPQEEYDTFWPEVYLTGPARDHLKIQPDSMAVDTLEDMNWPNQLIEDLKSLFKKEPDKKKPDVKNEQEPAEVPEKKKKRRLFNRNKEG